MFFTTVEADAFGTKCYLLARGRGTDCVIVDPGIGVAGRLDEEVRANGLRPVAVLLTHGHLDHTDATTQVCRAYDVPVHIHQGDVWMLSDPFAGLGSEFAPQFEEVLGPDWIWTEPDDVRFLSGGSEIELAGLAFGVDHTPGHTPGSVMFNLPGDERAHSYCLVGDTLHAGTIGRTDMPGGDRGQALHSLRSKILVKPDETVALTGHGRDSTVGRERFTNPFLLQAAKYETMEPADSEGGRTIR
ncbi:MBL fold metallo-hydrolase [Lipingzhangella sp. LS1_29]|uniref:MBL fold metallo-hydrolase n=1 Tax=Lipingzhangella rawalii TaxID=2055835 RepID=A0ABU2H875_9ACTN|nr:MBL fold metallo-hydrolase [Lipingzhangella rawalii]MDS1271513.1 MBL fold metallo-hydrolase [Lipingzhangella rawalii]